MFRYNQNRIFEIMRPWPFATQAHYLMARWRADRKLGQYWWAGRLGHKAKPNQTGGWLPGKLRLSGLKPMRRVIDPAVRYMPVTRQCNEIRMKYGQRINYLWAKRIPIRKSR